MREFSEKLEKHGITLASNQFEYSLVNRDAEEDGTLEECKRLGESQTTHPLLHSLISVGLNLLIHGPLSNCECNWQKFSPSLLWFSTFYVSTSSSDRMVDSPRQ